MTDRLNPQERSRLMQRIRSSNTTPELAVRSALHRMGYRFRLNRHDMPGRPDIVLPRHHCVIYVHGCFWHSHPGCGLAHRPLSNEDYWLPKLRATQRRDTQNVELLVRQGWRVLVVWECETRNPAVLTAALHSFLPARPSGGGSGRRPRQV